MLKPEEEEELIKGDEAIAFALEEAADTPSTDHQSISTMASSTGTSPSSQATIVDDSNIIFVWKDNVEDAFREIGQIVQTHPYVAMDTEFPGVVARPYGTFRSHTDFQYQAGVDFEKHEKDGIDVKLFGAMMMVSGLALTPEVRWVSFHSYFDFGYLIKVLTNSRLPDKETEFFTLLTDYFPCFFDIKYMIGVSDQWHVQYMMKSCESLKGGLSKIAHMLEVERVGSAHQAGSDSLVTALTFFKMSRLYFESRVDESKYAGVLFGLGGRD